MVEYKELSEYNAGDTVYIKGIFDTYWEKFEIVSFEGLTGSRVLVHTDGGTEIYLTALEYGISEQEYEDMQLERKFTVW